MSFGRKILFYVMDQDIAAVKLDVNTIATDKIAIYPPEDIQEVAEFLTLKEYADDLVITLYNDAPILVPEEVFEEMTAMRDIPTVTVHVETTKDTLRIIDMWYTVNNVLLADAVMEGIREAGYCPVIENGEIYVADPSREDTT